MSFIATPGEDKRSPHVLVIEDDVEVSEVVEMCIRTRWPDARVLHGVSGESGVELAKTEDPNIIILDVGLPDIDGFEVCSRIRAFSNVPVLILTVRNSPEDVAKGLDLGADDYLVKPFKPAELVARLNAVLRRSQKSHLTDLEVIFRQGNLMINFTKGDVFANGESIRLLPTDYEILYHLMASAGRVVATQWLLDNIWGEEYRDEPSFLTSRLSRLRGTLQECPQTEYLALQEEGGGYSLASTAMQANQR